jgi:hypothetical protein
MFLIVHMLSGLQLLPPITHCCTFLNYVQGFTVQNVSAYYHSIAHCYEVISQDHSSVTVYFVLNPVQLLRKILTLSRKVNANELKPKVVFHQRSTTETNWKRGVGVRCSATDFDRSSSEIRSAKKIWSTSSFVFLALFNLCKGTFARYVRIPTLNHPNKTEKSAHGVYRGVTSHVQFSVDMGPIFVTNFSIKSFNSRLFVSIVPEICFTRVCRVKFLMCLLQYLSIYLFLGGWV